MLPKLNVRIEVVKFLTVFNLYYATTTGSAAMQYAVA